MTNQPSPAQDSLTILKQRPHISYHVVLERFLEVKGLGGGGVGGGGDGGGGGGEWVHSAYLKHCTTLTKYCQTFWPFHPPNLL